MKPAATSTNSPSPGNPVRVEYYSRFPSVTFRSHTGQNPRSSLRSHYHLHHLIHHEHLHAILYQIVFSTKNREHILTENNRPQLFKYIYGLLKNKNCHLYRLNGVEDHIHILAGLHPSVSLSSLVKDIKIGTSLYIKENHLFAGFNYWQLGYGAFTYSVRDRDMLIEYVKNQVEHHKKLTFRDEFIAMLNEHQTVFDEKYLI